MAKLTFILGGAKSGKSAFAVLRAKRRKDVAYLATGIACDGEMKERIRRHREERPASWSTIEEAVDLDKIAKAKLENFDTAILDCAGSWITNLMIDISKGNKRRSAEEAVIAKVSAFLTNVKELKRFEMIIVSNEAGLGLVPHTKFGREFRDILGRVNQLMAKEADEVYFLISGIAQKLK